MTFETDLAMVRRRALTHRLLPLGLAALVMWLATSPSLRAPPLDAIADDAHLHFPMKSPYAHSTQLRIGNMEGIPLAIPGNLLEFAIDYAGESARDTESERSYGSKGFADPIRSFALYLRWPDLAGRSRETELSFMHSHTGFRPANWISVTVDNDYAHSPRPPQTAQNGLARVLEFWLSWLSQKWVAEHSIENKRADGFADIAATAVHFRVRDRDPVTGLHAAIPVGSGSSWAFSENDALYWEGDRGKEVSVLIRCPNGPEIDPHIILKCEHRYILPELGAYVSLRYTTDLLPEWREMQQKTREFILALRQ